MRHVDEKSSSQLIEVVDGELIIPNKPVVPFIRGDGIGPEIVDIARSVIDAAVDKAYDGAKSIQWMELEAGKSGYESRGEWLPEETVKSLEKFVVALKGPLTTPVGGGIRSLNVALRQRLELYACVRPCKWIDGVPAPVKNPEDLDVVIFRENTEDVYSGIEWKEGTSEAEKVRLFLKEEMGVSIKSDSGIGVKPISRGATERLMRAALNYGLENERRSITIVHKGNIMKYTEGAFREWGYALVEREFKDEIVKESEIKDSTSKVELKDKIVVKDRIADAMFQQVLLKPREYDIIVTTNLNGDYLSDACAAQVGGIGLAPSANINFESRRALFAPTHGTAPKYAGLDKANPTAMILAGAMMLEYMGWEEAGEVISNSVETTIAQKAVTADLARKMEGSIPLRSSEFGERVVRNIEKM
ncbi:MAG: isocitrate dehydrogenase (NADP(+)) [Thermoproteota archaeon]